MLPGYGAYIMTKQVWQMEDSRYDEPRLKQPGEPTEAKAPPKKLDLSKEEVIILPAYIWDPDVPIKGPYPTNPWKAIDVIVKISDLEKKDFIWKHLEPDEDPKIKLRGI